MKSTIFVQVDYNVPARELSGIKDRSADIYLHADGECGHINKDDLGGDSTIILATDPKHALVNVEKLAAELQACVDQIIDYACENELIIGKKDTFAVNDVIETIKKLREA